MILQSARVSLLTFKQASFHADETLVRAVQDRAPAGKSQYDNMFYFMIALKAVDVLYGFGYHVSPVSFSFQSQDSASASSLQFIDKKYFGSVLRLNEADRVKKEAYETDVDRRQGLRPARRSWTIFGLIVAVSLITTS